VNKCDKCGLEVKPHEDMAGLRSAYWLWARNSHRHVRCHPSVAQYITAPEFGEPVVCDDPADDKRLQGTALVLVRERIYTDAWRAIQPKEVVA